MAERVQLRRPAYLVVICFEIRRCQYHSGVAAVAAAAAAAAAAPVIVARFFSVAFLFFRSIRAPKRADQIRSNEETKNKKKKKKKKKKKW